MNAKIIRLHNPRRRPQARSGEQTHTEIMATIRLLRAELKEMRDVLHELKRVSRPLESWEQAE